LRVRLTPRSRQRQEPVPPIPRRDPALDQTTALEPSQDPAQVPRIQTQIPRQVRRRRLLAVRDLVQHPRLRQRERTPRELLLQQPDPPRVEPVEVPHRLYPPRDLTFQNGTARHGTTPPSRRSFLPSEF